MMTWNACQLECYFKTIAIISIFSKFLSMYFTWNQKGWKELWTSNTVADKAYRPIAKLGYSYIPNWKSKAKSDLLKSTLASGLGFYHAASENRICVNVTSKFYKFIALPHWRQTTRKKCSKLFEPDPISHNSRFSFSSLNILILSHTKCLQRKRLTFGNP